MARCVSVSRGPPQPREHKRKPRALRIDSSSHIISPLLMLFTVRWVLWKYKWLHDLRTSTENPDQLERGQADKTE